MAAAPTHRYIGCNDEQTVCDRCGKVDLGRTVVLSQLDADGNHDTYVRYGTSCAARTLGVRGGAREVRRAADWATERTLRAAKDSRQLLEHYGVHPDTGEIADIEETVHRYRVAHRAALWFDETDSKGFIAWELMIHRTIRDHVARIAEARLLGA